MSGFLVWKFLLNKKKCMCLFLSSAVSLFYTNHPCVFVLIRVPVCAVDGRAVYLNSHGITGILSAL